MPKWDPRDELAAEAVAAMTPQEVWAEDIYAKRTEIAALLADALPEQCQVCGGHKADDSTPKWVFRKYEICDCPDQAIHLHEWENYLHTAYVLVRTPLEHHCKWCPSCHQLMCEAK